MVCAFTPGREALDGPPRRRLVILGSVTTYRAVQIGDEETSAAARVSNPATLGPPKPGTGWLETSSPLL